MASDSSQKHIIVSGAAQGIGRVLSRYFLQKNHLVFLLDFNEPELTYTTTKHLASHAQNLGSALCNVRSVSEVRAAVLKAVDFFPGGRIDVLVNNAGICRALWNDGASMDDPDTLDQWMAYVETHLTGSFALSQACIPHMKVSETKQKQRFEDSSPLIVHVSSFRAYLSEPNQEGYAASKAGLLGLNHAMAITCQKWGIRVNVIAPGRIKAKHETKEADEHGRHWEIDDEDLELHASNRAGRPEDIAAAVEYLMGAGFLTGQEIVIDGGAGKMKNNS